MEDSKPTQTPDSIRDQVGEQLERLTAEVIPRVVAALTQAIATALEQAGLIDRVQALAERLEGRKPIHKDPPAAGSTSPASKQTDGPKGRSCSEPDCALSARARGLCSKHYQRLRYAEKRAQEAGEPLPTSLSEASSQRGRKPARKTAKRGGTLCSTDQCQRPTYAKGMCGKHFMEWVRAQKDLKVQQEQDAQEGPA